VSAGQILFGVQSCAVLGPTLLTISVLISLFVFFPFRFISAASELEG
jgi:hypothetical protein